MDGSGTTTANLAIGGQPAPANKFAETWNGSSWTEVAERLTGTSQVDRWWEHQISGFNFWWPYAPPTFAKHRILEWIFLD